MSGSGSAEGFGKKSDDDGGETLELAKPTTATAQEKPAAEPTPQPTASEEPAPATDASSNEATDADDSGKGETVEAEVRMSDGGAYLGTIRVPEGGQALDVLNSPGPFFELIENTGKVRLLSKAQTIQIMPYEKGTAAGRGGGSIM